MKGPTLSLAFVASLFALFSSQTAQAQEDVVINEVNLVTGPNYGQFVELYGEPNASLEGTSLVILKSLQVSGAWTALVQSVVGLDTLSLDAEGFLAVEGVGWQNTLTAVVLAEGSSAAFVVDEPASFEGVLDAVLYGNTSVTNPQMAALVDAVLPGATETVAEAGNESDAGADGLSRVPDGGEPLDQAFVMQALSPGTTNVLPCEGGSLEANNPQPTYCTDLGPTIVGFTHTSDSESALLTLAVIDASTGELLNTFLGSAINMEGLGDGTFEVHAISHSLPLAGGWTTLDSIETEPAGGCVSVAAAPVVLVGETCEIPSCDGGTVLTAGAEPDEEVCLTAEDGALVTFGYFSDAVEGEYTFFICDEGDTILASTDAPFFDFAAFGEAGTYHVWGLSTQNGLDSATTANGQPVLGASGLGCDSLSTNYLLVDVLQCGVAGLCDDLIISEYVEGTSNNKALEIHNPTGQDIDLTPYVMEVYNNGATEPVQSLDLEGIIPAFGVHVMGNPQAEAAIVNVSQVLSQVTWYNGNDPIVLRKNGEIIDMMGVIGEDPQGAWPVGEGAMAEYTLVRKPNVGQGSTNWNEGQTQWDVYPQDTFNFLGEHSASCGGLGTMVVGFAAPELYVSEGSGVSVDMLVSYPLDDVTVSVAVSGGDATAGSDFPAVFPLNFEFPAGLLSGQSFTFAAIDDEDPELQEEVELTMTITSGEAVLGIETVVVRILPSDLTYPVYEVDQVRGVTNQGVLDSIDVACELRGIVHGWNDYPQGLRFTLIDPTNGINVFSPINNFGYEVTEGDSVRVRGVVGQFNGLATLYADTLIYEGSGFDTQEPILVNEMGEETESRIVKLKCVKLLDPSEWTNNFPFFDVMVSYGLGEIQIRIDGNTDIWGTDVPLGTFGITGIGGQYDGQLPLLDSYTLMPRSLEDLTESVYASFTVPDVIEIGGGNEVVAENNSEGAASYQWAFGNGSFSTEENPVLPYTEAGTYNIFLTAIDPNNECADQAVVEVDVVEVDLVGGPNGLVLDAFPNPTQGTLWVTATSRCQWQAMDASGKRVGEGTWQEGSNAVDLSALASGTYLFRVVADAEVSTLRVVVP